MPRAYENPTWTAEARPQRTERNTMMKRRVSITINSNPPIVGTRVLDSEAHKQELIEDAIRLEGLIARLTGEHAFVDINHVYLIVIDIEETEE